MCKGCATQRAQTGMLPAGHKMAWEKRTDAASWSVVHYFVSLSTKHRLTTIHEAFAMTKQDAGCPRSRHYLGLWNTYIHYKAEQFTTYLLLQLCYCCSDAHYRIITVTLSYKCHTPCPCIAGSKAAAGAQGISVMTSCSRINISLSLGQHGLPLVFRDDAAPSYVPQDHRSRARGRGLSGVEKGWGLRCGDEGWHDALRGHSSDSKWVKAQ